MGTRSCRRHFVPSRRRAERPFPGRHRATALPRTYPPGVDDRASTGPLVVGGLSSMRSTVLMAMMTALVLPGCGLLILPVMLLGDEFQWGGLAWVAVWALPPFVVRATQREHRLDDRDLVSTYRRERVVTHPLSEVVAVRAAPLFLPAARITCGDRSIVWVYGPVTDRFISAVLQRAPYVDNQLPTGQWLRPRRLVWFVLDMLGEAHSAS